MFNVLIGESTGRVGSGRYRFGVFENFASQLFRVRFEDTPQRDDVLASAVKSTVDITIVRYHRVLLLLEVEEIPANTSWPRFHPRRSIVGRDFTCRRRRRRRFYPHGRIG